MSARVRSFAGLSLNIVLVTRLPACGADRVGCATVAVAVRLNTNAAAERLPINIEARVMPPHSLRLSMIPSLVRHAARLPFADSQTWTRLRVLRGRILGENRHSWTTATPEPNLAGKFRTLQEIYPDIFWARPI